MGSGKPQGRRLSRVNWNNLESFFRPLTVGERALALRTLLEDPRVASMANVGRFQVVSAEPWVPKRSESPRHRLARLVVYDYAANRAVQGCIDLQDLKVISLTQNTSQPLLSPEEECRAAEIAMTDQNVIAQLDKNDVFQTVLQYWSSKESDMAYNQRSAAVIFGTIKPTIVAIVNLSSKSVHDVVPAQKW